MIKAPVTVVNAAKRLSQRSNCLRKKVGAIIYWPQNGLMVASGWNTASKPCSYCSSGIQPPDRPCGFTDHAEMNALADFKAFMVGRVNKPIAIHTTLSPCVHCAEAVFKEFGEYLDQWTYSEVYRDPDGVLLLNSLRIPNGIVEA